MAEILIKAQSNDLTGGFKRGDPVVVMEDNHIWGNDEQLPKFVKLKIPVIEKQKLVKYVTHGINRARRKWRILMSQLPQDAIDKWRADGELTIKATTAYTGQYDYTWTQVKSYFHDLINDVNEDEELV